MSAEVVIKTISPLFRLVKIARKHAAHLIKNYFVFFSFNRGHQEGNLILSSYSFE